MKLTIKPTEHFFMVHEVMVRMWQGSDETGTAVVAMVTAVGFAGQAAAVAEGLVPIPPPSPAQAAAWWAQAILQKQESGS